MTEPPFQVGPGTWVRLRYAAFDADGVRVEEQAQEVGYVHGYGVLLPRLEQAVQGRMVGDRCQVRLGPDQAFGRRLEQAVLECDPTELPSDLVAGDRIEAETADGSIVVFRVLEVRPDAVVVDTNHPLAGQSVIFELEVAEARPASPEELERAEARLLADGTPREPLIPAQSLLRAPSRRYERG